MKSAGEIAIPWASANSRILGCQRAGITPAMEAGIADHVWDLEEVIMMADTARKNVVTEISPN